MEEITEDVEKYPERQILTGIKDTDLVVLSKLRDRDLFNACLTNKSINKACQDESFWKKRFISNFDGEVKPGFDAPSEYKKDNESWKQFYLKFVHYTEKYRMPSYLLRKATLIGDISLVVYALKEGAIINVLNALPLLSAVEGNYEDIIIYLINHGANITEAVFSWMCGYCSLDIIMLAIDKAGKSIVTNNEDMPIRVAANVGRWDVVQYLLNLGANIHTKDDELLRHATRDASVTGNYEMVHYLLDKGVNINRGSRPGVTPLMTAIQRNSSNVVKYLLQRGALVNDMYFFEKGVLSGNLEIVKLLMENKAKDLDLNTKITYKNKEMSLLEMAKELKEYEIYRYLLQFFQQ